MHFSQFAVSYDKANSVYYISNHLGNGRQFILGNTYVSKFVDVIFGDSKIQVSIGR
jgi:hypothetical protein